MLDLLKQDKPRPEICKTYGISSSTLQNFIREETKLRRDFEKNGNAKRCMIRNSPHFNLKQHLRKSRRRRLWMMNAPKIFLSCLFPTLDSIAMCLSCNNSLNCTTIQMTDFLNINQHEQSLSNSVKQWLQQAVSYLGLLYLVLDVQRNFELGNFKLGNFPLHFFQSH